MLNLITALVVSASLMPPGKQAYTDSAGNPLSGGKVYTYAAGTSTPLATYSDQAGATPNANPVVLNSRGEATIFWGAGPYKVTLRTSADALLWTQDNMYPPFTAGDPVRLYSGGNATTPELSWADDTNSGFYLIGPDNIGLSIGGTKRWDYAAAGSTLTGTLSVSSDASFAGSVTVATGSTRVEIYPTGRIELAAGGTIIDFKDSVSEDFDARIYKATGGNLEINGTPLTVMEPVADTDAATKGYVDAVTTTAVTAGSNWAMGGSGVNRVAKRAGVVSVSFDAVVASNGSAAWGTAVATVPAGFRPGANTYFHGVCVDAPSSFYDCVAYVATSGAIVVLYYDNGTALTSMFATAAGDQFIGSVTYVAEN